jgi:hypothetical protein
MDCLDIHNVTLSERYLGTPSDVRTSVSGAFKYLGDGGGGVGNWGYGPDLALRGPIACTVVNQKQMTTWYMRSGTC